MLNDIERHWEMLKDKSAVIVFDKYAERGRYFATLISSRGSKGECQPFNRLP